MAQRLGARSAKGRDNRPDFVGGRLVVAPGYESVVEVFREHHELGLETGSAFAAVVQGRLVVDLVAGHMDQQAERPLKAGSLLPIFEATHGLIAGLMASLQRDGLLNCDVPIAHYWHGFRRFGKDETTLADVLTHRAGLPGLLRTRLSLADLRNVELLEEAVCEETPRWHGSHAANFHLLTLGIICGAVARRVTGAAKLDDLLRERVRDPIGLDIYFALPASELSRVSAIGWSEDFPLPKAGDVEVDSVAWNPPLFEAPSDWSSEILLSGDNHALGGVATARAMAEYYALLLDGQSLIDGGTLAEFTRERVDTVDMLLGRRLRYGLGFQLENELGGFGNVADAFGHSGSGGGVHGAWPSLQTSFSYCTNRLEPTARDSRSRRLLSALVACVRRVGV